MRDDSGRGDAVARELERLARSGFRSSFHLSASDRAYARRKGRAVIEQHARDLLGRRVGPAQPLHDGRQTPYRGHPVFTAQHATATCCRTCIERWHHIPKGRALTPQELDRLTALLLGWLDRDLRRDLRDGGGRRQER